MGRAQMAIAGRDDELAALRAALRASAHSGRLMVVRGDAGIGKTRLLEAADRRWRSRGTRVAPVWVAPETSFVSAPDQYGVGAVVDALRQDFDRFGDAGLVDGISALARFHRREVVDPGMRFPAVAAELNWVFGRIGILGPVVVLIDDVLEIADPVPLLLAARRPGCLVVASMRSDTAPTPVSAEWLDMADEVLDLDSLDDEHIESLVGGDLDESVHEALRSALGPLYGNPGTVLETVARLREQGRIIAADNGFRLADPDSPIALPEGHGLLLHARRLGRLGSRLLAAVARLGEFDMDDLAMVADVLGEDIAECGRTVDRLVESSLLVSDSSGRLHCLCPALAVSAENQERTAIRRLPAPSFQKPSLFRGVGSVAPAAPAQSLSEAEARIVELISMGLTNRRIGAELGLSEKTVESQLTRLFARTGCRGRVELVTAGRLRGGVGVLRGRRAA